jgi:aspartate oxidase
LVSIIDEIWCFLSRITGGGAAGLSCALEASSAGAQVTLFEKMPKIGGNSAKASSGINGALTDVQASKGMEDSYDLFEQDTLRTADELADPSLVDKLVHQSTDAIAFLKGLGLPLADIIQLGGHSAARTHRLSTHAPIGFMLIKTLQEEAAKRENIAILTGHSVTSLVWEDREEGRVVTGGTLSRCLSDCLPDCPLSSSSPTHTTAYISYHIISYQSPIILYHIISYLGQSILITLSRSIRRHSALQDGGY